MMGSWVVDGGVEEMRGCGSFVYGLMGGDYRVYASLGPSVFCVPVAVGTDRSDMPWQGLERNT